MLTFASRAAALPSRHILQAGLIALTLLGTPAFAADTASTPAPTTAPLPASVLSSAPPAAVKLDAGPEIRPEIKPEKQSGEIKDSASRNATRLSEKRVAGKVTEVEVKKGKNTYYVKPMDPDARGNRGAQWKVGEFGGPKNKDEASSSASAATEAASKSVRKSALKSKTPASAVPAASAPDSLAPDSLAPAAPLETK